MEEHSFQCPYCSGKISMVLDLSSDTQKYVEDCEICCNPIEVSYEVDHGEITNFSSRTLEE